MPTTISASATQSRIILIGAALLFTLGMGIRQSFGLFLTPVTQDLAIAAADFTLALAIQNVVWGVSQAFVGAAADRYGLRKTMLFGAVVYIIGLIIMATAKGALALLISGALIGVSLSCTATSLVMTACTRAVSPERRSMTLGVVSAVGSIGTLIGPLTTQAILAHGTWQVGAWFFVALSVAMLPAAFLAGGADNIPQPARAATSMREVLGQAVRNRQYVVMACAYFVCGLNLMFLTTHLPSYLAICGQDPMMSASSLAVIVGVAAIGSLVTGWLGARFQKHMILGSVYVLRSLCIAAYFALPPTWFTTMLFSVAMGLLWWPGLSPLIGGLVAEIFGTRYMATLLGMAFVVHQMGSSLGTWGAGLIFDYTGSYDPAWQIGTVIGVSAGVMQMIFGGPPKARDKTPIGATAGASA